MTVAMVILMVGLLALAGAISFAVLASSASRNVTDSKLMIVSVLEQVESLRNSRQLFFGQIANAGQVDNTGAAKNFNGFPTTFQPVAFSAGPDNNFYTGDDEPYAGADGIYGTSDDLDANSRGRVGYERKIEIEVLTPYLKKVTVTLRYPGNSGNQLEQEGISYLNDDARGTFRP